MERGEGGKAARIRGKGVLAAFCREGGTIVLDLNIFNYKCFFAGLHTNYLIYYYTSHFSEVMIAAVMVTDMVNVCNGTQEWRQ